jgi:hypothetical protein
MADSTAYSTQNLCQRIKRRQGDYESRRGLYDAQRDVICELLRPDLVKGQAGSKAEGAFEGSAIVESTGPHALHIWQRGFGANMLSRRPGQEWFREIAREPPRSTGVMFKGNDEVGQWQQDVADVLNADMRRSNVYDRMGMFLLDGGSVGSPVMMFQQDIARDRIVCQVPDYASVWLDKDVFGYDNCLHVMHEWNALQAVEFFGLDALPASVQQQLRNGNHYVPTKYLQVIYGAGDPIYRDLPNGEGVHHAHPWLEHFIPYDVTDERNARLLRPLYQGPGYFTRPFASWHYHRNDHEVYSRTMAWWAIHDIRGLNAMWEALFGEAELSVRPATWAMDTLRGMLDLGPGGDNWARSAAEYEQAPQYLQRNTQWNPAVDLVDRITQSVQRAFHYPFFMAINAIVAGKSQPETAYGLSRVQAENGVQLVEQIESYEQQVLGQIHDMFLANARMAEPAYPWGRLPQPPDILLEYSDGEVDVEFVGPLSMTQINDRVVDRFYRTMGPAEVVFNANTETIQKFRWSQILEDLAEAQNFRQDRIVPEEEYKQIVEGARQRALQQEIAESAPKVAQAAQALQGKTEKGSPLAALTGSKG